MRAHWHAIKRTLNDFFTRAYVKRVSSIPISHLFKGNVKTREDVIDENGLFIEHKDETQWDIQRERHVPKEKSIVSRRGAHSSEPIWNTIIKGDCALHIGDWVLHIIWSDSTLPKLFQPVHGCWKIGKASASEEKGRTGLERDHVKGLACAAKEVARISIDLQNLYEVTESTKVLCTLVEL